MKLVIFTILLAYKSMCLYDHMTFFSNYVSKSCRILNLIKNDFYMASVLNY